MKAVSFQFIFIFFFTGFILSCDKSGPQVVVYTSLDQNLSEPVFESFSQKTGIQIKAVYDTEATKTTGLVNRLLAERSRPRCDVFWNSEVGRTIVLQQRGILEAHKAKYRNQRSQLYRDGVGYWTGLAARARVIIVNTNWVEDKNIPRTLGAFTDPKWKGQAAMANPHFGTTGTHFAALKVFWGDERFAKWLRDLKENDVAILPGNAQVRDKVASGEYAFGLTDTDDANGAILDGKPVKMIFPDQGKAQMGVMIIPNTVALVRGGPNPETGKRLIDFLLSPEAEAMLAKGRGAQIPLQQGVVGPKNVPALSTLRQMKVDYAQIGQAFEPMLASYKRVWHQ